MNILLVEDDALLLQGFIPALNNEGYACESVATLQDASACLDSGWCNLVILDVGLSAGEEGALFAFLNNLNHRLPVLIVTAHDAVQVRIACLDAGVGDDIIKPFSREELLARIRRLAYRIRYQPEEDIVVDDLRLEIKHQHITLNSQPLNITPKEYLILSRLMMNVGHPVARDTLQRDIYQRKNASSTNVLEVHIHHLREKIGRERIRTVRNVGYALIR